MHILHLSDLFLASRDRAIFLATHLADDLRGGLQLSHLDALILAGNLVQSATPEAYAAVEGFLHHLRREFSLPKEHIVLVPGNSDLDLRLSEEEAYQPVLRRKYRGSLEESAVIDEGGSYLAVLQPEVYKRRFQHFSEFYQTVKDAPYSLEYHQQFTLDHFPNHDILMLGLNSAWQLDHHYTDRAHIHPSALTNALLAISRNPVYRNCLKLAVWHHPCDRTEPGCIQDLDCMASLMAAGFRLFLHGYARPIIEGTQRYDLSQNKRQIYNFRAGVTGRSPASNFPWQYNYLAIEGSTIQGSNVANRGVTLTVQSRSLELTNSEP